jgi:broad specificity phosphatase PhoE
LSAAARAINILKPGVTLYLVRHGETDWNREARYQGQRDIALNETGRAQALRNGEILRAAGVEVSTADFVSSPLSRARETMRILRAEMGLEPDTYRINPAIKELNYGHWEGQLATDLPERDPAGVAAKAADPFGWRPDGGESYADLSLRIADWMQTIDRTTVAVTHGGVSRVARGLVLGLDTHTVPTLAVPQDQVLVLTAGAMRWI